PLEGRLGFGTERFDALVEGDNFGQVDIDEQREIVLQLEQRGYTTPARVGITGCSYGGYFTSQSITRHPGLYAAANSQCTLLDLLDQWSFGQTGAVAYWEGRTPEEGEYEYRRDSPLFSADKVRTPTLLFAGSEDFLPWKFSAEFHDAIGAAGTPARLVVFEGEGHGLFGSINSQLAAAEEQILWFRRY